MSLSEIINMASVGISSYNLNLASDIGIDQLFISPENLKSTDYLNKLSDWTEKNKMKLNEKKTAIMIFNPTKKYQFSTRLMLNNNLLNIPQKTKLLGLIISSDLTWHKNTKMLVKKAYQRTMLLKKLFEFSVPKSDLITIYIQFVRSVLEQSCPVWHSSITKEEETNLERVQRVSLRIILKEKYEDYENALLQTDLQTLKERRETLCLEFATKCTKHETNYLMFPLNPASHVMPKRNPEKYYVQHSNSNRLKKSAIPYL